MPVRAWQDAITIPTYPLGPEDPNPPFQRQNSSWAVYPYTLQDDVLEGSPEPKDYTALHIENEYLHCIVLPELGGHLYSLYDKVTHQEVFYRNNVIKWGLVAVRGAWISGGIEFNFPTGHTPTTVDKVSWDIAEDDGVAWLTVGNIDRVSRMVWFVRLRLQEGRRCLGEDIWLANRMPYKQRHWFWNNAAVPASDDLHLIYPARKARVAGGITDFPVNSQGRDISWYTAHDHADDIFTLDVREDYFGVHYVDRDFGMAHVAERDRLKGKKYFTWGTADDGMIWVDLLTDDDGQYVELQAGRFETQSIWEFLRPHEEFVSRDECWIPVHGMGGWTYADTEAVVRFEPSADKIALGVLPVAEAPHAEIALEAGGTRVWHCTTPLAPRKPFTAEIDMPKGCDEHSSYVLTVTTDEFQVVYEHPMWHQTQPKVAETGEDIIPTPTPEDECSAEELCVKALAHMTRLAHRDARRLFDKALTIDEGNCEAHIGLGILDCRSALYESAKEHLQRAVERNKHNPEAWHYLGLALWKLGDHFRAYSALRESQSRQGVDDFFDPTAHAVYHELHGDELAEAASFVSPLVVATSALGPASSGTTALDTMLSGLLGTTADMVSGLMAEGPAEHENETTQQKEQLVRWCRDDPELWLEAAWQESTPGALQIADLGLLSCEASADYPMTHYSLAYWHAKLGHTEEAQQAYRRARQCALDHCFPSRLEEIDVLGAAVRVDETDWHAKYLLGNLFGALDRTEEAMAQWRQAVAVDDSFAVLHRNLGYGCLAWEDDPQQAAEHYRRAIERNPDDYRYYLDLQHIYGDRLEKGPQEQLDLLHSAPDEVREKWQVAAHIAELLIALKRYDEGLAILQVHRFFPWEGATRMRSVWVNCLAGRAQVATEAGDHAGALADLELAATYPRNLGVAKLAHPQDARIHWLAAEQAAELGDDDKRQQHLQAAADEPHRRTGEADWWKLLALRELGRSDEAAQLEAQLREWTNKHKSDSRQAGLAKTLRERLDTL